MLLTLRGTPVLYQGDEIGLTDVELSHDEILDPVGLRFWPAYKGRDPERTPMPWDAGVNGGFTTPDATPWLPMGDPAPANVADQRHDPHSVLGCVRRMIAVRRRSDDLRSGRYASVASPDGTWVWRRGGDTVVALNLSDETIEIGLLWSDHRVAVGTEAGREGTKVGHSVNLAPWEGVVLEQA
jgi:alpha-glucosidase